MTDTKTISKIEDLNRLAVKITIKEGRMNPETKKKGMDRQELEHILISENNRETFPRATFRFKSEMSLEMPYKRVVGNNGDMGFFRPGITCNIDPAVYPDAATIVQQMNAIYMAGLEAAISKFSQIPNFITFMPRLCKINMGRGKVGPAYEVRVITTKDNMSLGRFSEGFKDGKEGQLIDAYCDSKRVEEKDAILDDGSTGKVWVFSKIAAKKPGETGVIYQTFSLELPAKAQAAAAGIQLPDFRKKDAEATPAQLNPQRWGISIQKLEKREDEEGNEIMVNAGNWIRDPTCIPATKAGTRTPFVGQAAIQFDIITATPGYGTMKCNWVGIAKKYPEAPKGGRDRSDFQDGLDLTPIETTEALPAATGRRGLNNNTGDSGQEGGSAAADTGSGTAQLVEEAY